MARLRNSSLLAASRSTALHTHSVEAADATAFNTAAICPVASDLATCSKAQTPRRFNSSRALGV